MRAVALVAGTYLTLQLVWFAHALFTFSGLLFAASSSLSPCRPASISFNGSRFREGLEQA